jgi:flavoprotein
MTDSARPRLAWAITGSGHYLRESLALAERYGDVDLFLSKAAEEILSMYEIKLAEIKERFRVFRDNTASAAPVGLFYHGHYHGVVIAPATSNTVAKCVLGISDTLPTNIFAQAGKCRLPAIVFACDTAPEMATESPSEWLTTYPRSVDLQHTEKLKDMPGVIVAESIHALEIALHNHYTLHLGQAHDS